MDENSAEAPDKKVISIKAERESKFLSLIEEVSNKYDEMIEIYQTDKHNKEYCEPMLSKIEKIVMALSNLKTYKKENLGYFSEKNCDNLRKLVTVISKIYKFLVDNSHSKISEGLNNEFDSTVQLLNMNLGNPFANFLPLKKLKFLPLMSEVTKIYDEISEIHQAAQYNKKTCWLMLKKVEIADTALNNLKINEDKNSKYFSKENYISLCNLITIISKIRKLLAEISRFESYQKFIKIKKNVEIFRDLNNKFNSTVQDLNFSSIISSTDSLVCTGTETASKIEVTFASFLPLIEEMNKLYDYIDKIHRNAQYNEITCKAMLERIRIANTDVGTLQIRNLEFFSKKNLINFRNLVTVICEIRHFLADISQGSKKYVHAEDIKEKFSNLIDEFETAIRLLQFYLIIYFVERDNNENDKIRANIEEEWIKQKIEDEDILYFEYGKFIEFEKIGKGGFGDVYKAETIDEKKVALKCLRKSSKIEENVLKDFVKELKVLRIISYHDNINSFLGITKDYEENYIMVLEYANNGNLRDYLRKNFCSLQWKDKIQMALDITCGLKCLHSNDIIHRDLHSKNILVNNGKLLIADFGLSKQIAEATSNSTSNRMGMTAYIDPQCLKSVNHKKNKKSDIYSLGVLLWEITSGHPPFRYVEQNMLVYYIGHGNQREKPIDSTPAKYLQLYQECWDDDPEKRPDVDQVYDEIVRISGQLNYADDNENPLIISDNGFEQRSSYTVNRY
ncbi:kinase-like domain-containing protein [Rhizophagus clarus]|uniref:Kinase-like domain-containing protein n=1 Tax=Rhizophagus clarus TaxID=94130 RepID=A0A8H3M4K2_9GLOM|nr:kinase-like domain-containing protein [Rhizophagus clarus]